MASVIGDLLMRSRKGRIILVILLVVVVTLAVYYVAFCYPGTIIGTGTVLTVPSYNHLQYGFTRPSSGPGGVYGEFSSDHPITMYVMDPTQFTQFSSTGSATSYVYSSGPITFATVGGKYPFVYIKQPGQYYLVFYNSGTTAATLTVQTTFSIEIC